MMSKVCSNLMRLQNFIHDRNIDDSSIISAGASQYEAALHLQCEELLRITDGENLQDFTDNSSYAHRGLKMEGIKVHAIFHKK